ncbi:MAG: hypothetical protein MI757_06010, partial [Pirellulales bacterium]|nr:hypothetical protein [Pirellulales bacterium]
TDLLAGMDLLDEGELFGIGSGFGLPGEPEKPQDEPEQPIEQAPANDDPEDAREPKARADLPEVDVDAGLALEMIGAKYQRSRMIDFLETMSDLSGVPITLDLAAIEPLKLGPASRVSITKGKTTVGDLIDDALKAHHRKLDVVQGDAGLVISAVAADRRLKMDHPVDDLAPDAADRAELIEMLVSLVPAPSWSEPDGTVRVTDGGTALSVDQPMQVQYEVIVFLEKLRTARNKPSRNRFYDARQFSLASRRQSAAPRLDKAVDVNVVVREPLAKVVRKLEWAAGTNIVVDWHSIRAEKVGRMTPAQLIARGRTLSEAMDALVEPLGLAWRVHDATTLQISTKSKTDDRRDVEIYDLRKVLAAGVAPADLMTQIRRDTTPTRWQGGEAGGRLHFDSAGSCLIVVGNQPTQVEVANVLDGVRKQNLARRGG